MPNIRRLAFPMLLAFFLFPTTSFAMLCDKQSGGLPWTKLAAGLTVGTDLPDGTIVWESTPFSFKVLCEREASDPSKQQQISMHINPRITKLGDGVLVGIRHNGKIYTTTGERIPVAVTERYCGIDGYPGLCSYKAEFDLEVSLVIVKNGNFPTSGKITNEISYEVMRVDRHESLTDRFYQFGISLYGLSGLRTTTCTPTLEIKPNTIVFPRAFAMDAKTGATASSVEFNLVVSKACNKDGFSTQAKFTPVASKAINGLLVPDDNDSVGIELTHLYARQKSEFNKWFNLHSFSYAPVVTIPYRADLIWRENRPKIGVFNAALTIELTHY